MEKLSLLTLLLSICSFAQIQVYEQVKPTKIGNVQDYSTIEKLDDIYSVCFDDIKFTKIKSHKCFTFKEVDNDFENLYNIINNGFQEKKEQTINLNLPNDLVDLKFVKNMGIISFQFITTGKNTQITGFSPYYTKRQIDKLFGKSAK